MRISPARFCILMSFMLLSDTVVATAQQPTEIIVRNGTIRDV